MDKPVIDVTAEYQRAEESADKIPIALQFGIPDLTKLIRSAYVIGFVDGARGTSSAAGGQS